MGTLYFNLPHDLTFTRPQAATIHTVGIDGIPWPCKVSVNDGLLSVTRNREGSGKTFVPLPFEDHGFLTVPTGTLLERERPYCLLTEVARGTLNRLRNQMSIWKEGGLTIPGTIHGLCASSITYLNNAIIHESTEQQQSLSRKSLDQAMDAVFELSRVFGHDVTQFRKENDQAHPFWMSDTISFGNLPRKNVIEQTTTPPVFDLARITPDDLDPESGASVDRRIILGPFLDASANAFSPELVECGDHEFRRDKLSQTLESSLQALTPEISLLHVAAGLNGMGHRHLSYPQQLETTSRLLEITSQSDTDLPTLVSFDFPWGERLASAVGGTHPLQIADSLLRQGSQISFLGIEVNLGYWPAGSVIRDPLQWIDMLDLWTQLGLPLILLLRAPTWRMADEDAGPARLNDDLTTAGRQIANTFNSDSDSDVLNCLETILPMLVARPAVHGVIWTQDRDDDDPRYPLGGLYDKEGYPKQILKLIELIER